MFVRVWWGRDAPLGKIVGYSDSGGQEMTRSVGPHGTQIKVVDRANDPDNTVWEIEEAGGDKISLTGEELKDLAQTYLERRKEHWTW